MFRHRVSYRFHGAGGGEGSTLTDEYNCPLSTYLWLLHLSIIASMN